MKMRYLNNWAIELSDFDISKSTTQIAHLIANLTLEHMVVVIRNQNLTPEQQINFCSKIGAYQSTDTDRAKDISLTDGVLRVTGQKNQRGEEGLFGHTSALDWHANQASNYERKPLIWLYGAEGTKGSITSWINNIESYNNLPEDIKEKIKNTKITLGYKVDSYSPSKFFKEHHAIDRPFNLVHTNDAKKTGLYFPFLQVFGGLDDETFNTLKNHILKDEFRYDHHWQDGDIVLSEQWLSIHKRHEFNNMKERVLHRIAFDYSKLTIH
jgi:taurine dioxygenase